MLHFYAGASKKRIGPIGKTIAFVLLTLVAFPADATTICYPRDQMISYISKEVGAVKIANAIERPYTVVEVWVAQRTGEWLVVSTDLQDSSCIVASGDNFRLVAGALAKEPVN